MLPTSNKGKRGGTQIGAELLKLKYGQRTPVFLKENSKHRKFGCWYLRIRPKNKVSGSLEGIIKIEKMAVLEEEGLDSSVVDRVSFKYKSIAVMRLLLFSLFYAPNKNFVYNQRLQ